MQPLLDMVLEKIPGPEVEENKPFRMLVTNLDWSEYVGRIAVGRVQAGSIKKNQQIDLVKENSVVPASVVNLFTFDNLGRVEVEEATAGDVTAIVGMDNVEIGDTICQRGFPDPLPRLKVDEPTLEMIFSINSSPFAGREGKYVTTRQLRGRLEKELERNVALRMRPMENADAYAVSGRGVLHLAVLIETMRREGFELSVGKPRVVLKEINGVTCEPFESLTVEVPTDKVGPVMEMVGNRRGMLDEMTPRGDYTMLRFSVPARGLIGLRTRMLNATQGTAIINHRFSEYRPMEADLPQRSNGVLVSMVAGKAVPFALFGLQDRSELFVAPGQEIYEGMIVGENARDNDLTVNPCREKKLTNMRASGSDENVILKPPRTLFLEAALEYIEEDELVEITPQTIRLRKISLKESDRRRQGRAASMV
jgi:GTP-binding protein